MIFGTGPLGKWTARELIKHGKQIRLINRSGTADRLPEGAEIVAGDAYDVNKNIELTKGAAVIYQCAQPLYQDWVEKFPPFQSAIMEAELGKPVKVLAAGTTLMSFLGLFNPAMRETVEMMYEYTQPFIMDSSKAEKAFGWKGTSLQQAMRETILWLCEDIANQKAN